jgi:hypothetical protein
METQNEVTSETLATLATTATTVAKDHEAFTEALSRETQAEAALLERIIVTVKPALRALASRITKEDYATSGRNGCNPVSRRSYFDERGVCVVDAFDREKDETGNRGSYGGSRLYLLDDGRLAEVDREGTWSCWQGEADVYTATLTVVVAAEAVRHYHLTDMIEAINTKLAEQVKGEKAKRTKAAHARAEKLAAVASLMGAPNAS